MVLRAEAAEGFLEARAEQLVIRRTPGSCSTSHRLLGLVVHQLPHGWENANIGFGGEAVGGTPEAPEEELVLAETLRSCSFSEGTVGVVVPRSNLLPFRIYPSAPGAWGCSTLTITSLLIHGWSWGHDCPTQNQRV